MTELPLHAYLLLALALFSIGLYGALTKRNAMIVLVSIALMFSAANINLLAFGKYGVVPSISGQVFALFSIALATTGVVVGVAILLLIFRQRGKVHIDEMNRLQD